MKPNIEYVSVLDHIKSIEERNKAFDTLDKQSKRLEIAWDALKLLTRKVITPSYGHYWGDELVDIQWKSLHSEDYQYATTIMIGKVPMTQWHTGTRYIPYYTYCITIQKIADSDTFTRNLSISKSSYEYYKVGDKIKVLE